MSEQGFWWSDAAVEMLKAEYRTTGPTKLAMVLGTSLASVICKARRLGIEPRRKNAPPFAWTDKMLSILRELYPTADRATLVESIGVPYYVIQSKAHSLGIRNITGKVRGARTKSENSKSCDIHFFDEWSHDMSYVLGFIWADGSITKRGCDMTIGIASLDDSILHFIKRVTKSRRPFHVVSANRFAPNHSQSTYFTLGSKVLVNRLVELGMKPRKTYNDDPFPQVPDDMMADFIRGYFDGDGTAHVTSQNICRVGFIGTVKFIVSIRDALVRFAGMKPNRVEIEPKKYTSCGRVLWSAINDLKAFSAYIYPPGHGFCLERKKRKLFQWLESKTHTKSSLDKETVRE